MFMTRVKLPSYFKMVPIQTRVMSNLVNFTKFHRIFRDYGSIRWRYSLGHRKATFCHIIDMVHNTSWFLLPQSLNRLYIHYFSTWCIFCISQFVLYSIFLNQLYSLYSSTNCVFQIQLYILYFWTSCIFHNSEPNVNSVFLNQLFILYTSTNCIFGIFHISEPAVYSVFPGYCMEKKKSLAAICPRIMPQAMLKTLIRSEYRFLSWKFLPAFRLIHPFHPEFNISLCSQSKPDSSPWGGARFFSIFAAAGGWV